MSGMFCQLCGLEMVKEPRVLGDPALDCGGDCLGCVSMFDSGIPKVISRDEYPAIYDDIAFVYGGTTAPMRLP